VASTTHDILRDLQGINWIDVAFLLSHGGQVMDSVGESAAFDPNGSFAHAVDEPTDDADTSLYMTAITDSIYLGVLFAAETPIEDVRVAVRARESELANSVLP